MYTDYAPVPNFVIPVEPNYPPLGRGCQVVVVEGGEKAKDVMRLARQEGLTTRDADGNEIFWIVFSNDPRRVWDFTGKALRQTLWSDRWRQKRR